MIIDQIQFGLQTRVEMLEGLDIQVLCNDRQVCQAFYKIIPIESEICWQVLVKARWVLRTPGGKVLLHIYFLGGYLGYMCDICDRGV